MARPQGNLGPGGGHVSLPLAVLFTVGHQELAVFLDSMNPLINICGRRQKREFPAGELTASGALSGSAIRG